MYYSIFNLFKIGIGPSSSHTVGPINAAIKFLDFCSVNYRISNIKALSITLHGSLAHTAVGHGSINGLIVGLNYIKPENIDLFEMNNIIESVISNKKIKLKNSHYINFDLDKNIILDKINDNISDYSNKITFAITLNNNKTIKKSYFSIGGGDIIEEGGNTSIIKKINVPYSFKSGEDLLMICKEKNINIYDIILENEKYINPNINISKRILYLWNTMNDIIKNGITKHGTIDSELNVKRRANTLYNNLKRKEFYDPLEVMDWVNIFAISTCEENASNSKIVTAPTNGAAGIIPAVLKYYVKFIKSSTDEGIINFLSTAAAIGGLFKMNASISGADVGCQGEVGVACSMAAAGLTAALDGSPLQIENAAEIGMEHNLGLTCDPINGLVQIPCIERNSMGAIKAINASRLSLSDTGEHKVSLDQVIKTMNDTGKAMNSILKETSLGGLAVNVIEC